jgi:hypothetical protein
MSSTHGNKLPKAAIIFLKFGKVLPIPNALNFQLRGANWSGALSGVFSML